MYYKISIVIKICKCHHKKLETQTSYTIIIRINKSPTTRLVGNEEIHFLIKKKKKKVHQSNNPND